MILKFRKEEEGMELSPISFYRELKKKEPAKILNDRSRKIVLHIESICKKRLY